MFKRILVPLDFSASSLRALDDAVALARSFKAELILMHAVEPIYYAGAGGAFGPVYDTGMLLQELARSGREQLSRIAAKIEKRRVKVRTLLQIGTPYDVILRAAKKQKADLILLSTHGRTGLAHVLMGSVAEKVVQHASCAVLTVRGLEAVKTRSASRPTRTPTRRAAARPKPRKAARKSRLRS